MLVIGNSQVHYADQVVEVKKQALSFSNPHIPINGSTWIKSGVAFFAYSTSIFSISMVI